jgi:hypothetical protein
LTTASEGYKIHSFNQAFSVLFTGMQFFNSYIGMKHYENTIKEIYPEHFFAWVAGVAGSGRMSPR